MKILLDTNFLIYCAKEKLDYKEEIDNLMNEKYEVLVPEQVLRELNYLKTKAVKGKDKSAASLALQLLKAYKIRSIKLLEKNTDQALLNYIRKNPKSIIATLDRNMRYILGKAIVISRGRKLMLAR